MNKLIRAGILSVAPLFMIFAASPEAGELPPGLYARFTTTKGVIVARLFFEQTPMTVANFVGLAEGTIDNTSKGPGQPYYDGIVFHRVIPDFMIQGGDPTGTGTGGPGYKFADEIRPNLRHDSPGILSMANAGPGTNGSQFFITHVPTPHLDGKHTVFGKVVSGQNVVDSIQKGDRIQHLEIVRVGPAAQSFRPNTADFRRLQQENANPGKSAGKGGTPPPPPPGGKVSDEEYGKIIRKHQNEAKSTMSGLQYVVLQKGDGPKPRPGQNIEAEYTGRFMNGKVFDTSIGRGPFSFKVGKGQVIEGWDEALSDMRVGEKRALIVPPKLGYGAKGAGNAIPPNTTLYFEVELKAIK